MSTKKFTKKAFAFLLSLAMVITVLPAVSVKADVQNPGNDEAAQSLMTVTVSAYDYTAVKAGIKGTSKDGEIVSTKVTTLTSVNADNVVKQAFEQENIPYEMPVTQYGTYVQSINGLGPDYDDYPMSGWMMAYDNDDYSNYGLSTLNLKDGDQISFDYSLDGGIDLGGLSYGCPTLSEIKIGDKTFNFVSDIHYDENYNIIKNYSVNGEKLAGSGTKEDPFTFTAVVSASAAGYSNVTGKADISSAKASADSHYVTVNAPETIENGKTAEVTVKTKGTNTGYYVIKLEVDETAPARTSTPAATEAPAETSAPAATNAPAKTTAPAATNAPAKAATAAVVTPVSVLAPGSKETVNGASYKVSNDGKTVAFVKVSKKNKKTVTVPAKIKLSDGKTYKVTTISNSAFAGCKKLKKVTIGKNVKKLGKNLFKGDKKLKKIIIKTKVLKKGSVNKKAFSGVSKKVKVTVPSSVYKKYKKILTAAGLKASQIVKA